MHQLQIASWTITKEEHLRHINLGTTKCPQYVKINVALFEDYAFAFTNLLKEFKDVFAWTYKNLKGIPLKLHSIVVNLIFQYH